VRRRASACVGVRPRQVRSVFRGGDGFRRAQSFREKFQTRDSVSAMTESRSDQVRRHSTTRGPVGTTAKVERSSVRAVPPGKLDSRRQTSSSSRCPLGFGPPPARRLNRRYPGPKATSPADSWMPAGASGAPDSDARVPSDDGDGDGSGDSVDDPAEAANRDPLRRQRPRRRPVVKVRRWSSAAERVAPSSGDRPGCPLIHDFVEAYLPYLSSPAHRCCRLPRPPPPRRPTTLRSCASRIRKLASPTASNI